MGFILFDSQAIVERAARGKKDFVSDALTLFVDAAALFTRLLVVLLQRQGGQGGSGRRAGDEDENERRRRGGGGGGGYDPKGKRRAW
jgi:hypothetical protein